MIRERVDVAVIGGGPAGLTAAAELCRRGVGTVCVIEREQAAGGIPRHADHQGFGLRDLHRSERGPAYARRLTARAQEAGVEIRLATQVTAWSPAGELELTGPGGRIALAADAVVLATGCRERPRSARLIPGTRPQGVMTTATLQQLVHLERVPVGTRAVVVGAEHVAYSALATLAHAGARTAAMITEHRRHQSFAAVAVGAAALYRVPLRTRTVISEIFGSPRVERVALTHLRTGVTRHVACDLVVLTGDWIPDYELTVSAGAELDPGTHGPVVDQRMRTTRPGLFAAGNVLHGAEPADVAALTGRVVAAAVADHLRGQAWPAAPVPVVCEWPLHWIVPNRITAGSGAGPFRLRAHEILRDVTVECRQDGRALQRTRLRHVMPGRSVKLSASWTGAVDPAGGPVQIRVISARSASKCCR